MKPLIFLTVPGLIIASLGFTQTVFAESIQATCEFTRSGDRVNNASGDCTFSQLQGNISITLHNGDNYELRSSSQSNQYTDQNGNNVEARSEGGGTTQYKWNNKNIRVSFDGSDDLGSNDDPEVDGRPGEEVVDLQGLVSARAGFGDAELERLGYKSKNNFTSGGSIYTHWRNQESRQCIAVQTTNDRYQAIVYSNNYDCKQSEPSMDGQSHSGSQAGDSVISLQDLVGLRVSSGERELETRGYKYKNTSKSGNSTYSNWKDRNSSQCITVRASSGEYQSIVYATDSDCKNE